MFSNILKQLSLNNQKRICQFFSNIFHQISNAYNSGNDINIKETSFELAHLSLVVYCPNRVYETAFITNPDKWNKMLKSYFILVESEIKYLNSQSKFNRNPGMDEKFLKFSADLCYMVFTIFSLT